MNEEIYNVQNNDIGIRIDKFLKDKYNRSKIGRAHV